MPGPTRWFVKAALLYLVGALAVGVALVAPGSPGPPALGSLGPVYFHLFMVGWVTQLIFGVSLWMFPRHSRARPQGRQGLQWLIFGALNAGLLLRAVAEPLHALRPGPGPGVLLLISAGLQWAGGLLYALAIWPRVRER